MSVVVAVVGSRTEAELMVGMLRNHGIQAAVSGDDAGGVDLALQSQGVRVLVATADGLEAKLLLSDATDSEERRPNALQRGIFRLLGGARH
jgi:hypothetical protein